MGGPRIVREQWSLVLGFRPDAQNHLLGNHKPNWAPFIQAIYHMYKIKAYGQPIFRNSFGDLMDPIPSLPTIGGWGPWMDATAGTGSSGDLKWQSTYVRTYVCMYECMYVCMYARFERKINRYNYIIVVPISFVSKNVCMYVCMHACMDGWMDGWMDVCMYVCMNVCMYVCINFLLSLIWNLTAFDLTKKPRWYQVIKVWNRSLKQS